MEKRAGIFYKEGSLMKHVALSKLGRRAEPPAISWLMEMALGRPQMISLAAGFTTTNHCRWTRCER